nr:cysteine dioxygenase family protein [Paraburkholderia hayleyella]
MPLARLCTALSLACEAFPQPSQLGAFGRRVRQALAEAISSPNLLKPAQREGAPDTYQRHLLAADPHGRYAVAALVWMPGQASPVHAHHTWCGYAVLDGTLSETVYTWDEAAGYARATRTHPRDSGAVSFAPAGHGGIHQLRNLGNVPAVSLHLYAVAGEQIATHVNDILPVAPDASDAIRHNA